MRFIAAMTEQDRQKIISQLQFAKRNANRTQAGMIDRLLSDRRFRGWEEEAKELISKIASTRLKG